MPNQGVSKKEICEIIGELTIQQKLERFARNLMQYPTIQKIWDKDFDDSLKYRKKPNMTLRTTTSRGEKVRNDNAFINEVYNEKNTITFKIHKLSKSFTQITHNKHSIPEIKEWAKETKLRLASYITNQTHARPEF